MTETNENSDKMCEKAKETAFATIKSSQSYEERSGKWLNDIHIADYYEKLG